MRLFLRGNWRQRARLARPGVFAIFCTALAGCAGPGGTWGGDDSRPAFANPALSLPAATALVVPGKSTKAEVAAALGKATVIPFDSGFEVWVYRGRMAQIAAPGAEFVLLFEPSGILKKSRVRLPSDVAGR